MTGSWRRVWRRPAPVAAWLAVLAGEASLVPSMLPRQMWVQGIFTGVVAANVYALVVFAGWATGPVRRRLVASVRHRWRLRPRLRHGLVVTARAVAAAGALAAMLAAAQTSTQLALDAGVAPEPWYSQPVAIGLAVLVAAVLVLLARGLRALVQAVVGWLRRTRPRNRLLAVTVVVGLVVGGVAVEPRATADDSDAVTVARLASVADRRQVRSGGLGSLVAWDSLTRKGQEFVAGGPDAAQISEVTGQSAMDPVRVYVGKASAGTLAGRVHLAIRELRRTHGFQRAAIVVAVPTGSGWVNPAAPAAAEYLYGGDLATVAVQYSTVPSWQEYLTGLTAVRDTSQALLRAVNRAVDRLPADRRPRVLIYGESLGALGALLALTSHATGLHTDGQLWAGVPAQAPAPRPGVDAQRLVHADDPVAAWSPKLLWGPTPQRPDHWLPVVTFWQATADLVAAYAIPYGHGHRYGTEFVDAWHRLAPAIGVPGAAPTDRLTAVRSALPLEH